MRNILTAGLIIWLMAGNTAFAAIGIPPKLDSLGPKPICSNDVVFNLVKNALVSLQNASEPVKNNTFTNQHQIPSNIYEAIKENLHEATMQMEELRK